MSETTTPAERKQDREELLESLRGIKKMRGNATLETVGTITERAFWEMFGLADELRGRIEMLEEKSLRYQGVHDKSAQYNPGDCVTAKGGLWHCEKSTRGVPGAPNSGFRLMHKTPIAARGAKS